MNDKYKSHKPNLFLEFTSSIKQGYERVVEHPLHWFFDHVIPKSEYGTETEGRYPLTFLVSVLWLALATYIMSAVCQRWVEIVKEMGYISLIII